MKLPKLLLTIAAAMAFTAAANADLSYTFDADVEGFQNVIHSPGGPAGWPGLPTVQQNHAIGGWQMMMTKEFSWGPGGGSANHQLEMQALVNSGNARLSFDAMVDFFSFTPMGSPTWYQLWVVGNSDGVGGWTQTQLVDAYQNPGQMDLRTWHFDLAFNQMGWNPEQNDLPLQQRYEDQQQHCE